MGYSFKDIPIYPTSFTNIFGDVSGKGFALPAGTAGALMLVIFILFFIAYCIVSGVLFYHWRTYGMKNKMIISARALFTIVSLALFWTALVLIGRG